jgi:hypothetical protein
MPEGNGRNLNAPQAGAAFWDGGLVAAAAVKVARPSTKPITAAIILPIIPHLFSAETPLIAKTAAGATPVFNYAKIEIEHRTCRPTCAFLLLAQRAPSAAA